MPLRDHLRAEQDGPVGAGEALQCLVQRRRAGGRVRVEAHALEPGHVLLQLPLQPLRAGADPGDVWRAAGRAELGRRLLVAAVVAAERPVSVQDERDVAAQTAPRLPARAAVERRNEAAAVQEQDRLAAVLLDLRQLGEQRRRERIAGLAAHVHDGHRRKRRAQPAPELETLEPRPALRPRRRRAVQRHGALERGPLGRHRAGVVARVGFLLVGRIVLLVHADKSEPRQRREHGRARADDDRRRSLGDALPLVPPLRLRQARMQHRDPLAEPGPEAAERLRRERDLGDEHDRAAPPLERRCARLKVHLRLAAAGRAVEQEVAAARLDRGGDPRQGGPLRLAELGRLVLAPERILAAGRLRLAAARRLRRCDERERAGGRGAVVLRRPQRQVDERRR